MNGHSAAETLAFSVMQLASRWGERLGDSRDAPVFIFGTGRYSGAEEFAQRLSISFGTDQLLDAPLLDELVEQLLRVGTDVREGAPPDAADVSPGAAARHSATRLAAAQTRFIRMLCQLHDEPNESPDWAFASSELLADYAIYLRVLFPRARFLFIHRCPLETLAAGIRATFATVSASAIDAQFVESFAESWVALTTSFQLWHEQVGGRLVPYRAATVADSKEIEEYLDLRLSPPQTASSARATEVLNELPVDVAQRFVDRVAPVAARLGYRIDDLPRSSAVPARVPASHYATHAEAAGARCIILVPAMRYIEPECEGALRELERRGYTVQRVFGASPIDHARSRLATAALDQGFEETVWIDADTGFEPADVDRLRAHRLPIVAGVCARKNPCGGLAMAPVPGMREFVMGEGGGLNEVLYAGTGFLLVRREVYSTIQKRFNLPLCDQDRSHRAIPFFMPMLEHWGSQMTYLGEDYAFSRRARLCGYRIMADTSIRLWHIGPYKYGYEDAGNEIERLATYRHIFDANDDRETETK